MLLNELRLVGPQPRVTAAARSHTYEVVSLDCGLQFHLQPIVRLADGGLFGKEALLRGRHPDAGGWTRIDAALVDFLSRRRVSDRHLFINISHDSLLQIPSSAFVQAAEFNSLFIEISEAHMDAPQLDRVCSQINRLIGTGARVAIDDYGSGQDGLGRLSGLDSVSAIKIDGSILRSAQQRPHVAHLLKVMVELWNSAGVLTIAECIETPELLQFARKMSFVLGQGYYIDDLHAFS